MKIYKEEIFGPVLSVARAPDYDTAARMINEHEFGNGTSIFTRGGDAESALLATRSRHAQDIRHLMDTDSDRQGYSAATCNSVSGRTI